MWEGRRTGLDCFGKEKNLFLLEIQLQFLGHPVNYVLLSTIITEVYSNQNDRISFHNFRFFFLV
jgi:hypothetical protein